MSLMIQTAFYYVFVSPGSLLGGKKVILILVAYLMDA